MKKLKIYHFVIFVTSILFYSCQTDEMCLQGSNNTITETINVQNFNGIDLRIAGTIILTQGPTQEVKITANDNIIEELKTNVNAGIWDIDFQNDCYSNYNLKINITVPNIDKVYISGSGDITVNDFENQNDMTIKLSGSGKINLNKITGTENLIIKISGSGRIDLLDTFSTLENLDISMSGSGSFNGFLAPTKVCNISSSGSGNNKVNVLDNLNVSISGSGNTYYKGIPEITQSISGSGSLINAN